MIVAVLPKVSRPSAPIICLDERGRILLLRWRDPFYGSTKWEPPGGGIDAGETPLQAARRDHEHTEWFYLARITKTDVRPAGLRPDESNNFLGYRWFSLEE